MEILRLSREGDEEALKKLWETVFGDERRYIDTFFEYNYKPGSAMLLEADGLIVSAIYMVPMGGMCFPDGEVLSASITYALATYPEYRSHGYGSTVMRAAIQQDFDRGYICNSLCPAEDSLFPYYTKRIGYRDCFYVREAKVATGSLGETSIAANVTSPESYNDFRNDFLRGRLFMMFDDAGINYQRRLCTDTGGDLLALGTIGAACCEYLDENTLFVKELLCPDELIEDALAAVIKHFPAKELVVRTPSDKASALGGETRRYGQMMRRDGSLEFTSLPDGYYGFGYD
jgi:GNAT superfamily N-acetyltransferase